MNSKTRTFLLLATVAILISGCAEGMFWKSGYLSPWVRQQWADEEQVASTLFANRTKMQQLVDGALDAGPQKQIEASEYLAQVVTNDPIMLVRIEATRFLGQLSNEASIRALQTASRDRESRVRMAAVRSLQKVGGQTGAGILAQMAKSDADSDVRIAATSALGGFQGNEVINALAQMVNDPDPAMQLRAAESLAAVTGQDFGQDIQAWQSYLKQAAVAESPQEEMASRPDGGFLNR